MHILLRSVLCLLLCCACLSGVQAQKKAALAIAITKDTSAFTYKIIDAANGTFGYDIYKSGRLAIHQPTVPAMPGNAGFTTKAAAKKVAQLAIQKMAKGESLPTISPDELKKLKAI